MKTLQTPGDWAPHDQATTAAQTWHDASQRRARRVFAGLYGLAVLCLIWCALPMPGLLSAAALLPAIVAAQVVGALALLGWLLAWPRAEAEHDEPQTPLERWLVAVAQGSAHLASPADNCHGDGPRWG